MMNRGFLSFLVAAVAAGSVTWAAGHPKFVSQPPSGPIVIDGRHDDWTGTVEPFGSDPVSIQVANDGEFLYVRLVASDPAVRGQIMRRGLIMWFDDGGKTKKRFGLRYPVVESSGEQQERGRYGSGHRGGGGARNGDRPSDESYEPADRIDVLSSNKDDERSLTLDHAAGLEAAARVEQGTLRYELKVPLARSTEHPYAIGTAPGKTIGIGIESPKMERPSNASGGGGGGRGGDRIGGMGGHGGGGMHGGGGERGFQPPKPLNDWGTVVLR
jgi:hypothetical protein